MFFTMPPVEVLQFKPSGEIPAILSQNLIKIEKNSSVFQKQFPQSSEVFLAGLDSRVRLDLMVSSWLSIPESSKRQETE